jgi:hypothetical protein
MNQGENLVQKNDAIGLYCDFVENLASSYRFTLAILYCHFIALYYIFVVPMHKFSV